MRKTIAVLAVLVLAATAAWARELTSAYVVPAAANTQGDGGTFWHTDLTLHNPHSYRLPIVLYLLPSNRDNSGPVPVVEFELLPFETLNLWNVLGEKGFNVPGASGALLVFTDGQKIGCATAHPDCDFAVFTRTYTESPIAGGEYGQAIPGFPAQLGLDNTVMAYLPQLMNDTQFRTNLGIASWTDAWVRVRVDLQDPDGTIVDRRDHWVPPLGHIQWRLETGVTGGTAVAYIVEGPADAMVYPYGSVVNWATGDPSYVEAQLSTVGISAQSASVRGGRRGEPRPEGAPVEGFSVDDFRGAGR